jgi:hypothetical protein
MADDRKTALSSLPASRMRWLGEPAIADVLSDPIVRQIMSRDAVRPEDLTRLMSHIRARPA